MRRRPLTTMIHDWIPKGVARLIDAAEQPFYCILLMTLYGTGARRIEAAHLKVGDIDSKRMVVHIQGGKGNRDRDVMLSQTLLDALRDYWRGLRRKPTEWLFPGNRWHTGTRPITTKDTTACAGYLNSSAASATPISSNRPAQRLPKHSWMLPEVLPGPFKLHKAPPSCRLPSSRCI